MKCSRNEIGIQIREHPEQLITSNRPIKSDDRRHSIKSAELRGYRKIRAKRFPAHIFHRGGPFRPSHALKFKLITARSRALKFDRVSPAISSFQHRPRLCIRPGNVRDANSIPSVCMFYLRDNPGEPGRAEMRGFTSRTRFGATPFILDDAVAVATLRRAYY